MPDHDLLAAGRASFQRRAWGDACRDLRGAVASGRATTETLVQLATAAHLSGHDETAERTLEDLHLRLLDDGDVDGAARWAVWLAILLFLRGRHAQAGGWLSRAGRLLAESGVDGAARGWLLVPAALQALDAERDAERAHELFAQAWSTARRFDDPELAVLGLLGRGQALVAAGDVDAGVPLLDEVMVAVTTDEVSPVLVGIVYCAVVVTCRSVFDLGRAREWTEVLDRWCDGQQDLRPFRGQCLVHRSELLQLQGDWDRALDEVERACSHLTNTPGDPVLGMAHYQRAELLRLRGQLALAEASYRHADELGHARQPGLALLRLAQGRVDDAMAATEREVANAGDDPVRLARVLAARVEAVLVGDDPDAARTATDQLERVADALDSRHLRAVAARARGTVHLARGEATRAAQSLRRALRTWQDLGVAYEAAEVRLLLASACRELGDHDTADAELDAATPTLQRLEAVPALGRAAALSRRRRPTAPGNLTPREVEVLRLVTTGATNREVAEHLGISPRTVARHLENTFTKLGVSSRAAATAWAYEHDLT